METLGVLCNRMHQNPCVRYSSKKKKKKKAIPLLRHMETMHTLVGIGSTALSKLARRLLLPVAL